MSIVIAESLAGKRVAITGSTGFVGTALVERLLRCVPDCELILLVRDGRRTPAPRRVEKELLKNDAFDRLRELHTHARRDRDIRRDDITPDPHRGRRREHRRARAQRRASCDLGDRRRHHPLRRNRVVRLTARSCGRDQPARPDPDRPPVPRARRLPAPRRGQHLLRRRQPARQRARRVGQRGPLRHGAELAVARSLQLDDSRATPKR